VKKAEAELHGDGPVLLSSNTRNNPTQPKITPKDFDMLRVVGQGAFGKVGGGRDMGYARGAGSGKAGQRSWRRTAREKGRGPPHQQRAWGRAPGGPGADLRPQITSTSTSTSSSSVCGWVAVWGWVG